MSTGRMLAIGTVVAVLSIVVGGLVAVDFYLRRPTSEPEILRPKPTVAARSTAQPMLDPPPTPTLIIIPIVLPPTTVTAPPTPTRVIVPVVAGEPESEIYKIQEGDTLIGIANRFGVTVEEILGMNQIEDPSVISVGEELLIPPE